MDKTPKLYVAGGQNQVTVKIIRLHYLDIYSAVMLLFSRYWYGDCVLGGHGVKRGVGSTTCLSAREVKSYIDSTIE